MCVAGGYGVTHIAEGEADQSYDLFDRLGSEEPCCG